MSLLTMVEQITSENGWPVPTTVIGNTADDTVVRILAQINRSGRDLVKMADFVSQKRVHSFNSVASTAEYALPSDFLRFRIATVWDQTTTQAYGGPLSDQAWEAIDSGGQSAPFTPSFKVIVDPTTPFTNEFNITPTPSAVETTQFRYISKGWVVLNGNGARTTGFGLSADSANYGDTDTSLIDEDLIAAWATWRFLRSMGFPYLGEKKDAEDMYDSIVGADGGNSVLSASPGNFEDYITAANTPNRGFG